MFSQPLFVEVDTIFRNLVLCKLKKKHAVVLCCNSSSGGLKCTCNATWQTFLFRRINLNPSSLGELVASFSLQNRFAQDLLKLSSEFILPVNFSQSYMRFQSRPFGLREMSFASIIVFTTTNLNGCGQGWSGWWRQEREIQKPCRETASL